MTASTVLLAPHHDDECLFAGFLALEHRPDLIVCTRGEVQGERGAPITHDMRAAETDEAWAILNPGRDWTQWHYSDIVAKTDFEALGAQVAELADRYDRVIVPCPEAGGHVHHNAVGAAARRAFGIDRCILYLTYTDQGPSTWGEQVTVRHPDWIAAKHRALACYTSQIREPSTRAHFLGPLTEYVAP